MSDAYSPPPELVLGTRIKQRVAEGVQKLQRAEVEEILRRLRSQPGLILADEVGMGKTFVALAVAYSVAIRSRHGPVIVMVPANLVDKWEQDLKTFYELYIDDGHTGPQPGATRKKRKSTPTLRYAVARHSVELMKLLDDPARKRCHLIFLTQGAMSRRQTDKWVRLALIAEALRRHAATDMPQLDAVQGQIHRFLAELLSAIGEERAQDWGDEIWRQLLRADPSTWKDLYNQAVRDERSRLSDDPVPGSVVKALRQKDLDLKPLAKALEQMPVRARGGHVRVSERLSAVRSALRQAEETLWKKLLSHTRWRSPLLIMDEAHHLKNPSTALARQFRSVDLEQDLRTGDGAMARAFDRMLFLTATPFQLGHHELVRVMERFGDVRWDAKELGDREVFEQQLVDLGNRLDESQRTAIALQRSWSRLRPEDCGHDLEGWSLLQPEPRDRAVAEWWKQLLQGDHAQLTNRQRAVVDAYRAAQQRRDAAEESLRPWVVRHNKGLLWEGTAIARRQRLDGAAIIDDQASSGILIPPEQLLPFYLAARSAIRPGQDLLGEALSSSYEAFRFTRQTNDPDRDELDASTGTAVDLSHAGWYLSEFDRVLGEISGAKHPKMHATVQRVVDLWEAGEKVLVFAFYRHTCRALRIHISQEIERRIMSAGQDRLREAGRDASLDEIGRLLDRVQSRYFDDKDGPGRRAVDAALSEILHAREAEIQAALMSDEQCGDLMDVMRRFLRVSTTLVRCFPIAELDALSPGEAVRRTLDHKDDLGIKWRDKFDRFVVFLTGHCSTEERRLYLEAARRTQTRGIRVEGDEGGDPDADTNTITLANVQVATGETRRETRSRLMRAFNTPFFPDIFVCSEVMGEGVDLQRFCRHVIHHDLAWNPSSIEQRTGRIDRLGCIAEGRQPIVVYLPYLAGTADERQYHVMSDREKWFRVVMGQDEVARLITADSTTTIPLPDSVSLALSFKLGLDDLRG